MGFALKKCPKCGDELYMLHSVNDKYICYNPDCVYFKKELKEYKSGKLLIMRE